MKTEGMLACIGLMKYLLNFPGRPGDDEVMIGRLLEKSIRRTEAIDREALCILAGEKVKVNPMPLRFSSD